MKLDLAPRAVREAERCATWWREHRPAARRLFEEELRSALELIRGTPHAGSVYELVGGKEYRRLLMPETRQHRTGCPSPFRSTRLRPRHPSRFPCPLSTSRRRSQGATARAQDVASVRHQRGAWRMPPLVRRNVKRRAACSSESASEEFCAQASDWHQEFLGRCRLLPCRGRAFMEANECRIRGAPNGNVRGGNLDRLSEGPRGPAGRCYGCR